MFVYHQLVWIDFIHNLLLSMLGFVAKKEIPSIAAIHEKP